MEDLVERQCPVCGIHYAIPRFFYEKRLEGSGKDWYCPNGHCLVITESTADKLRRERDQLRQRIAERDDTITNLYDRVETEERRTAAYKGHVTKLKKRASAGVCPCCQRSFENLRRHMASKHPAYTDSPDLEVIEGGAAS